MTAHLQAEDIVRGVADTFGALRRGINGPSATACLTQDLAIGLVDATHGVAILTSVRLTPDQAAGLEVNVEASDLDWVWVPEGWTPLAVQLRDWADRPATTPVTATGLVAYWGLPTVYAGERGKPGRLGFNLRGVTTKGHQELALCPRLDPAPGQGYLPPGEWPMTADVRQRFVARGVAALETAIEHLQQIAGPVLEDRFVSYNPASYAKYAATQAATQAAPTALTKIGLASIGAAVDANVHHTLMTQLRGSVIRAVTQALTPVAAALMTALGVVDGSHETPRDVEQAYHRALLASAIEVAGQILAPLAQAIRDAEQQMVGVYYENGPVAVDLPALTAREVTAINVAAGKAERTWA